MTGISTCYRSLLGANEAVKLHVRGGKMVSILILCVFNQRFAADLGRSDGK